MIKLQHQKNPIPPVDVLNVMIRPDSKTIPDNPDAPSIILNVEGPKPVILERIREIMGRYRPETVYIYAGKLKSDAEGAWLSTHIETQAALFRTGEEFGQTIFDHIQNNDRHRVAHGSGTHGELAEPGDIIVVVGAGPSLKDSLPGMRKHIGKYRTFVVDRAVETVREAGIIPSCVVAYEWREEKVAATTGFLAALPYCAHPDYANNANRVVWTRQSNQAAPQWVPSMPDSASTTGYAIRLAILCHADVIILVGCDSAFSDGEYMPNQDIERDVGREATRKLAAVGSKGTKTVDTDQGLMIVWTDIADASEQAGLQDIVVCNATVRGASIPGTLEQADWDEIFPDAPTMLQREAAIAKMRETKARPEQRTFKAENKAIFSEEATATIDKPKEMVDCEECVMLEDACVPAVNGDCSDFVDDSDGILKKRRAELIAEDKAKNPKIIKDLERTCSACPTQYDAKLDTGEEVYIRYRHGFFTIDVDEKRAYEESIGDGLDGTLSHDEVLKVLERAGFTEE